MSARSLGKIQAVPTTDQPDALGSMGNFDSPLKLRSYKDYTPLLGYKLVPPYTPVNDNFWVSH